jgi:transposase
VEFTHNVADRAFHPAVIFQRKKLEAQYQFGSEFVAQLLTVVTSFENQWRDVLKFLTQAICAVRLRHKHFDLMPQNTAEVDIPWTTSLPRPLGSLKY